MLSCMSNEELHSLLYLYGIISGDRLINLQVFSDSPSLFRLSIIDIASSKSDQQNGFDKRR